MTSLMDLFSTDTNPNLLPFDGEAIYYGRIMSREQADHYSEVLLDTIAWKNDEAILFGKRIVTPRKVAWYAGNNYSYTYSGTTKESLIWTNELLELKSITEKFTGDIYNSCLLNLYHNGKEGMAYHSDDEKALGNYPGIASLSFGAERKFLFKHKVKKTTISCFLENGSLLLMKGSTQAHWLHRLPPTSRIVRPRINITFRTIIGQD